MVEQEGVSSSPQWCLSSHVHEFLTESPGRLFLYLKVIRVIRVIHGSESRISLPSTVIFTCLIIARYVKTACDFDIARLAHVH